MYSPIHTCRKAIADRQEEQGVQDGLDGHPLKDLYAPRIFLIIISACSL